MRRPSFVLAGLLLALVMLLAACGGSAPPDWADTAALEVQAKEIIDAVNAKDYERLAALYFDGGPTVEEWPSMLEPYTEDFGAFDSYGATSFVGTKDDTFGELCTALVETKYENKKMVWQVTFAEDGEAVGLHL